jgi:hypothetical protein
VKRRQFFGGPAGSAGLPRRQRSDSVRTVESSDSCPCPWRIEQRYALAMIDPASAAKAHHDQTFCSVLNVTRLNKIWEIFRHSLPLCRDNTLTGKCSTNESLCVSLFEK